MFDFTILDWVGLGFFLLAWFAYHTAVEQTAAGQRSLNRLLNAHRYAWMRNAILRDNRIVDTTINASLQNGTAFFASTSLIAIGATLTLLKSTSEILGVFGDLPFGAAQTRLAWEVKVLGLTVIFMYAFFKFAWSYRLFNYGAILIGAIPNVARGAEIPATVDRAAWRAASVNTIAGRHFNRGQRAFFFAVAYLGWFVSGTVLIVATAGVLYVMWRRQFASDALAALGEGAWPDPP